MVKMINESNHYFQVTNLNSTELSLNAYQNIASETAVYPKGGVLGLAYVALGLGEAGEFQGKVKKIIRDDNGMIQQHHKDALSKELGDVLWYIANAAVELGLTLEDVARENLKKLRSRAERGQIKGSGDDR